MPKKFAKILSLIIFTQIFCCAVFLIPISVDAIDPYKFQVPIGSFDKITFEKEGTTKPIADYIQAIYKYAIGVVAILATVVMMIGGVVWITAGGNQGRVGEAKQYISGALTGMVLVFCSYMILNTINPDLVKLKTVGIKRVTPSDTDANFYNSGCGESQHLGYGSESFYYNDCTITLNVCTCVPGEGKNICNDKGVAENCKTKGYILGKADINEANWGCDEKKLCHECCSMECEKENCNNFTTKCDLVCK